MGDDIAISGKAGTPGRKASCGGYSAAGSLISADAILIPSAMLQGGGTVGVSNFCGQGSDFVTGTTTAQVVCSTSVPFRLTFVSDTFESLDATNGPEWDTTAAANNAGFRISYDQ